MPDEFDTEKSMTPTSKRMFVKGWKGGPGNPLAGRCAQLRAELCAAATRKKVRHIAGKLIRDAMQDEDWYRSHSAIRILFDRLWGKPKETVDVQAKSEFIDSLPAHFWDWLKDSAVKSIDIEGILPKEETKEA